MTEAASSSRETGASAPEPRPRTPAQLAADTRLRDQWAAIRAKHAAQRQATIDSIRAAREAFNAERIARGRAPLDFDAKRVDRFIALRPRP